MGTTSCGPGTEANSGSVFSVSIPVSTESELQQQVSQVTPSPTGSFNQTRVLCIDNDPAVLQGMDALLTSWGCQVFTARDRDLAMHGLKQHDPEIILGDYQLDDGETGIDVLAELKRTLSAEVPCVLVTANNQESVREKAESAGLFFLPKPVKPASLRALLNSLLIAS